MKARLDWSISLLELGKNQAEILGWVVYLRDLLGGDVSRL